MLISILIPCYNESSNIQELLSHISNIKDQQYEVEYILINNGSTDNTEELFKNCRGMQFDKNIRFLTIPVNKGYGYGIKQGVQTSRGKYVGWIHGDVQIFPEELEKFFAFVSDCSNETLLLKGKRNGRKLIERIFTTGMGVVASLMFGKPMKEVMSTPVIISKDIIPDNLEDDFGIDIEVYHLAIAHKARVYHIPVTVHPRHAGVSSWNTGLISRVKTSMRMLRSTKKIKKKYQGEK